ncbi:hypothetical protein PW52_07840 [Tamlana sedimentorum]|uniref:Outer membrane protein beta-barrel domain-containing protein n=1 Tax=Neotamlana sedimentorum TaxID=1435349 RepID=A0A0D7W925_9FLAO|nr:hypothetical protein [Tamlana sedimentorum]KJD35650.1 hypothetical protein PW52_07840 [Tamlana sedimentorum]
MNKYIAILLLAFSFPAILLGQEKGIPINISFFNESTAVPFTRFITTPIHPGIQLGTEFNYKVKEHSRLFQTANISYFYHNYLAQGIGLNTEFGYEYRLKFGLALQGLLGVGYMHTFATSDEFTFSNGQYIKKVDKGNSRFYPSLSLDLGYYLNKNKNSPKIFIRYQSWIEYPYSPGFIDIMSHVNIHIGTKIFI